AAKPQTRRAVLRILLVHADARVRAAGLTAAAAAYQTADEQDRKTAISTLVSALFSNDPVIAGTAAEATATIYDAGVPPVPLEAAVITRAAREREPELSASLYELIGKHAIASGAEACRAGLTAHPVRARAAAECLRALGEAAPAPPI